jgi:hypothetical protein
MSGRGVVYVADIGMGRVKLGYSMKPGQRVKKFAREFPNEVVHTYISGRMAFPDTVEGFAITRMAERFPRWRGREWFLAPLAVTLEIVNECIDAHWHPSAQGQHVTPWPEK